MKARRVASAALLLAACGTGTADQIDPRTEVARPLPRPAGAGRAARRWAGDGGGGAGRGEDVRGRRGRAARARAHGVLAGRQPAVGAPRGAAAASCSPRARPASRSTSGSATSSPGDKPAWQLRQPEGDVKVARLTGTARAGVRAADRRAGRSAGRSACTPTARRVGCSGCASTASKRRQRASSARAGRRSSSPCRASSRRARTRSSCSSNAAGVAVAWVQVGGAGPGGDVAPDVLRRRAGGAGPPEGRPDELVRLRARQGAPDRPASATAAARCDVLATAEDGATDRGQARGPARRRRSGGRSRARPRASISTPPAARAMRASRARWASRASPRGARAPHRRGDRGPGAIPEVTRGEPPKYVLFVIMDSLRADRVRAFNPKARAETPNFDKLAEPRRRCSRTTTCRATSRRSRTRRCGRRCTSRSTRRRAEGRLDPDEVRHDRRGREEGRQVRRRRLRQRLHPPVARLRHGVGQVRRTTSRTASACKGDDVIEHGLSFITPKKDQPWFLYLGLIDTHVTWRAKQPWIDKYDRGYKGRFAKAFGDDGPRAASRRT